MNGMAPKMQASIQQPVTMQQPSSILMFSCGFVAMMAKTPQSNVAMPEKAKGSKPSSMLFLNDIYAAKNISMATPIREKPVYRMVIFHFFMGRRF